MTHTIEKRSYRERTEIVYCTGMVHHVPHTIAPVIITYTDVPVEKIMDRNQFIITKNGFQGPVFSNGNNDIVKNILKDKTPVKTFPMSDGSDVFLYSVLG